MFRSRATASMGCPLMVIVPRHGVLRANGRARLSTITAASPASSADRQPLRSVRVAAFTISAAPVRTRTAT
jgi:hypothetical protein